MKLLPKESLGNHGHHMLAIYSSAINQGGDCWEPRVFLKNREHEPPFLQGKRCESRSSNLRA